MADELDAERQARHNSANERQIADSLERIANRAAKSAVHETFRMLGFDLTDQDTVNTLRDDFGWLHRRRIEAEAPGVARTSLLVAVSASVTAAVTWLVGVLTGYIHFGGNGK